VDITLEEHPFFERQGDDLITRRTISYPAAALGDSMTIELIGGDDHEVPIEAGTQPGTIITIAGKGTPSVNGPGRGSLHVVIQVDVPRELSREARKILKTLREELSGSDENGKNHAKTA
jgi:molecular chaperone DnaJ